MGVTHTMKKQCTICLVWAFERHIINIKHVGDVCLSCANAHGLDKKKEKP